MKTIIFVLCIFLFAVLWQSALPKAFAESLTCDPQAGVVKYVLEVNGINAGEYTATPEGSVIINLDSYSPGPYVFRLRAISAEGWGGEWSDPFGATKPLKSGGVKIVK